MTLDYITYSDIIFEYFFNPNRSGQATLLAFDDDEARHVAEGVGESPSTFAAGLMSSVQAVYKSRRGFGWWRDRHPRERTGLLACSVFLMSSMGVDDENGFYVKYYREVLGEESAIRSHEFAVQSRWWEELRDYLNDARGGDLGRLVFLEVVRLTHLNFPASQCVLRGVDRLWLWEFFSRWVPDPSIPLTQARFLATWKPGSAGEPVGVRRMGTKLIENDESAAQIWEIFAGEFEAWRSDPVQQEKIARRRIRREGRPLETRRGRAVIVENSLTDDDMDDVTRGRTRYNLYRPMLPAGKPYVLRLEALPAVGVEVDLPELEDGWVRIPDQSITASQFLAGCTVEAEHLLLRVPATEIACFSEQSTGLTLANAFPAGRRIALLFDEAVAPDLEDFLGKTLIEPSELPLDDTLAGLKCVVGRLDANLAQDDLPDILRALFVRSNFDFSFRSGLRLRDGRYLPGGPPLVRFIHATRNAAPFQIDQRDAGLLRRGLNPLPRDLAPGLHTVGVLDRTRSFRIAFPDEIESQTYDLTENSFGFITRARPALIQSSPTACSTRRAELERMNAVVVQGADILLPYARTT